MKDLTDKEFYALRDYIKENFGISLGDEKKSLVYSRLRSVLVEHNMEDFTEYFDYLKADKTGSAITRFIDRITTNHTYFMRESDHFDYFRDEVLPYIETQFGNKKDLTLWCAACSSGEEAYTLQMILSDFFEHKSGWDHQILATDISTQVLDRAVRGVYTDESLSPLPSEWRRKYMRKIDNECSVMTDELKKLIAFRKFNLMEERFPFKRKFQVIFCRNVMIYFDNPTKEALIKRFQASMEPGGYLFVGHSESLNHLNTGFKYIKPAIYRNI